MGKSILSRVFLNRLVMALFLLAAIVGPMFIPLRADATGGVIDAPVTPSGNSYQRHSFYAQGLEWVFYQPAGSPLDAPWYLQTGNVTGNVTTWSGVTSLPGCEWQDVYFDGTYCHSVGVTGDSFPSPNRIYYRRSEPLGNGTLVLGSEALVQANYSEYTAASVCVNGSGYPFICASWYSAGGRGIQLMHGDANDGTYGTNSRASPDNIMYGDYGCPGQCCGEMIPMSGDNVLCVWGFTGTCTYYIMGVPHSRTGYLFGTLWNGSSWGVTQATGYKLFEPEAFSAIGLGATVQATYLGFDILGPPYYTITYNLVNVTFDLGTGTWVGEHSVPIVGAVENYDSYPLLTLGANVTYLAWPDSSTDSIHYMAYASGAWGALETAATSANLLGVGGHYGCLFADYATPALNYGVYWFTAGNALKFSDELISVGYPSGSALTPSSIAATSVTMNGLCVSDGALPTTAVFRYQGSGTAIMTTVDPTVISSEHFSATVAGLTPNCLYWYWVSFTNRAGTYLSNTVYFTTLATSGPEAPQVQTLPASSVAATSVDINGYLSYDGGLDCYLGFQYREQGATDWIANMHGASGAWPFVSYATYRSPQSFGNTLSGLKIDTTYEYQALAKNGLAPTGVYGNVTTFTTLHASGPTPTPTVGPGGGGGIHWPWGGLVSANVKLILALVTTIGGMLAVGIVMGQHGGGNTSGVVTLAYGLACVVGFSVYGFYPFYVLYLIGGIVALGLLLVLAGRGGSKAQ